MYVFADCVVNTALRSLYMWYVCVFVYCLIFCFCLCMFLFVCFLICHFFFFFFFQAEDGIRYHCVTGVQTCALPICLARAAHRSVSSANAPRAYHRGSRGGLRAACGPSRQRRCVVETLTRSAVRRVEIGRASCRERV